MGTHSREVPGGRAVWEDSTLWRAAKALSPALVPIDSIPEFETNCWFRQETPPTCRRVAEHARRIFEADLGHPIILSADGRLMDGGHRLAKAWISGQSEIMAVRFAVDPEPDELITGEAAARALEPAFDHPE